DRGFVSNPGGLYLTAVLPYGGDAFTSRGFALAVGWALRRMLHESGAQGLRLRWPNDLMAGHRKVGGILVEQGSPDTLLVGVGLNVFNQPWVADRSLEATTGRLADVMPGGVTPELRVLAEGVLRAIRTAHEAFGTRQLAGFVPLLNECWGSPREVELEPAGGVGEKPIRGRFCGIDQDGGVLLRTAAGATAAIPAHRIGRLREVV